MKVVFVYLNRKQSIIYNRIDFAQTGLLPFWLHLHFPHSPTHGGYGGKTKGKLGYNAHTSLSWSSTNNGDAAPGLSESLRSADSWRHRLSVIRADNSRSLILGVLESLSQPLSLPEGTRSIPLQKGQLSFNPLPLVLVHAVYARQSHPLGGNFPVILVSVSAKLKAQWTVKGPRWPNINNWLLCSRNYPQ